MRTRDRKCLIREPVNCMWLKGTPTTNCGSTFYFDKPFCRSLDWTPSVAPKPDTRTLAKRFHQVNLHKKAALCASLIVKGGMTYLAQNSFQAPVLVRHSVRFLTQELSSHSRAIMFTFCLSLSLKQQFWTNLRRTSTTSNLCRDDTHTHVSELSAIFLLDLAMSVVLTVLQEVCDKFYKFIWFLYVKPVAGIFNVLYLLLRKKSADIINFLWPATNKTISCSLFN